MSVGRYVHVQGSDLPGAYMWGSGVCTIRTVCVLSRRVHNAMQYQLSYPLMAALELGITEACVGSVLRSIRCFVCPPPPIYRNLQRKCTFSAILAHGAL